MPYIKPMWDVVFGGPQELFDLGMSVSYKSFDFHEFSLQKLKASLQSFYLQPVGILHLGYLIFQKYIKLKYDTFYAALH